MSDTSGGDGFMGQSPDFWRNLSNFGANLSVASNARSPSGFLTYGSGFGGPLGAATLANQQFQAQNPFAMGELQRQHAALENQGQSLANQLTMASLPFQYAKTQAGLQALGGGQSEPSGQPVPVAQSSLPFATRLGAFESGGGDPTKINPSALNEQGFAGKYQLGTGDLFDAGIYKPTPGEDLKKNEWKGILNIAPYQPMSIGQFLQNPQAQDAAFGSHVQQLEREIKTRGLDQYEGQTVGGVPITHEGLLAGMHLAGPTGMQNFLTSGGKNNPADANGTTIPKYISAIGGIGTQQPTTGGYDQNAMATAQQHYDLAKRYAWVNPEMAKVEQAQGDKWLELAQAPQKAMASAQANVWEARNKPLIMRDFAVDPTTGKIIARNPQLVEVQDTHGRERYQWLAPPPGMETGEGGTMPGPGPVKELAPGEHATIKEAAERYGGENEVKQFHAAQMALAGAQSMESDFNALNSKTNWAQTGPGAPGTMAAANWVNATLGRMGIQPAFNPNKIASYEDLQRQVKLAGDQLTNQFFGGGREAASTIMNSQKAIAGAETSPLGAVLGVANIREVGRMGVDRRNFMTNWMLDPKNEGDMRGAEEAFYKARPPEAYALRARSMFEPIQANLPGGIKKLLPGTRIVGPDGSRGIVGGNADIAAVAPSGQ